MSKWLKGPRLYAVIFALAVIAVNLVVTYGVIGPAQGEQLGSATVIQNLKDLILTTRTRERAVRDIKKFEKKFLSGGRGGSGGMTSVIKDVFDLAGKNRLKIPSSSYKKISSDGGEAGGLAHYTISFPVQGRYRRIRKFIYGLETLPYPLVLEELAFSRSRVKGAKGDIELKMRLSVYLTG